MEVYIGRPANSEKDTFEVATTRKTKTRLVILIHARETISNLGFLAERLAR